MEYNGDEKFLWAYGQTGPTLNQLVQIALPDGNETGVTFDIGSVVNPDSTGIAGGLASDGNFVPGHFTLIGCMQATSLWGIELSSDYELTGYNIYYSYDYGPYEFLDFVDDTAYSTESLDWGFHCYYVTAQYESGESGPSDTACEWILDVHESGMKEIEVYPNPASGMLTVSAPVLIADLQLYTAAGQRAVIKKVGDFSDVLDLSGYYPGVYLLHVRMGDEVVVRKVIVR